MIYRQVKFSHHGDLCSVCRPPILPLGCRWSSKLHSRRLRLT